MEDIIILKWRWKENFYRKELERSKVLQIFEVIDEVYPVKESNSQKRLLKIIRKAEEVYVDMDQKPFNIIYRNGNIVLTAEMLNANAAIYYGWRTFCHEGILDNNVSLKWRYKGRIYERILKKEELLKIFGKYKISNPENCNISSQLVTIIPVLDSLYIDWESNLDVNSLYYYMDGVLGNLPIKAHHRMIWGELQQLCDITLKGVSIVTKKI